MQNRFFELLPADKPFQDYAEKVMLFGQFIGSWDIDALWRLPGGGTRTARGEWHFGWILGGRGVQDVLFSTGSPPDHFGTTLRCYDPEKDLWHVTWMQPYGGEFFHLTARQAGERIVLEGSGTEPNRLERWSFNEIKADSFLWLGEASFDGGKTWILQQEMRARRMKF